MWPKKCLVCPDFEVPLPGLGIGLQHVIHQAKKLLHHCVLAQIIIARLHKLLVLHTFAVNTCNLQIKVSQSDIEKPKLRIANSSNNADFIVASRKAPVSIQWPCRSFWKIIGSLRNLSSRKWLLCRDRIAPSVPERGRSYELGFVDPTNKCHGFTKSSQVSNILVATAGVNFHFLGNNGDQVQIFVGPSPISWHRHLVSLLTDRNCSQLNIALYQWWHLLDYLLSA